MECGYLSSCSKNHLWILFLSISSIIINSITDKFYDRGREKYLNNVSNLSEYVESYYGGFGNKIRQSEKLLMNEKRISLQAVVTF